MVLIELCRSHLDSIFIVLQYALIITWVFEFVCMFFSVNENRYENRYSLEEDFALRETYSESNSAELRRAKLVSSAKYA